MEKKARWLSKRGVVKKASNGVITDTNLERGPKGFVLCRFCGRETKTVYNTFCSSLCVHNFKMRTQPGYLRECILKRDRGICQDCKVNCIEIYAKACALETLEKRKLFFCELGNDLWKVKVKRCLNSLDIKFTPGMFWEAAHIIDVQDGGGASGLENLRTLCVPCHQKESLVKLRLKSSLHKPLQVENNENRCIGKVSPYHCNEDLKKPSSCLQKPSTGILTQRPSLINEPSPNLSLPLDNSSSSQVPLLRNRPLDTTFDSITSANFIALGKEADGVSSKVSTIQEVSNDVNPYNCGVLNQMCSNEKGEIRKRRPFSQLEIDALIVGINQFGQAWSKIKREYSTIFKLRSPVDLKDKARNLAKTNPNFLKM
ncbi:hypothetical protein DSO57_1034896 [Entomophthora muscae]|uniref:Uncharacterized protein n=2 Tax=Entomophthora muscae TaxID=34485 RepID=A0ACC2T094_9FUNG|nr:hypothetical protein DSO57_1034896 [Entomophthora muscae]